MNFKTSKKSYKTKEQILLPPDQWVVFENTQEAIIDKDTFAIVQKMRESKRAICKRNKRASLNMFSGLLYCLDCGKKMYYHSHKDGNDEGFVCASFRKEKRCRSHYVTLKSLTEVVLGDLRRVLKSVTENEREFERMYLEDMAKRNNRLLCASKSELKRIESRCNEIDEIIRKLYEDNVRGRITDDRFDIMSKGYEKEKAELKVKAEKLRIALQIDARDEDNLENFKKLVKHYTEIPELTTEILNAFIEKIYIGQLVKTEIPSKRKRKQIQKTRTIRIVYRFIGAVNPI